MSESGFINIGPYWINPQHLVYCLDHPELPQPALHLYLRHVGGELPTSLTLKGAARAAMLAWLERPHSGVSPQEGAV